ncbi:MAG: right-handed parallel beta-helix repeat-containing protein [Spirochaetales bacterium]|nr:right-handed parallel beta-helix repeat-containing protein [Spirochaetales bacterium]
MKHNWQYISFLIVVMFLLVSCPSGGSININREAGFAEQKILVERYFSGTKEKDEETKSKKIVLNAAELGFDPLDSTVILQKCFDSDADVVMVPRMESPWITLPLRISRPMTVIFEEGSILEAKRGEYHNGGDSLLTISNTSDVSLYGYGARFRMFKEDYREPPYKKAEWRMTIAVRGSENILIAGLQAENSGGDGIYLGRGQDDKTNINIHIKDVVLKNHYRQGISIITVDGLVIENSFIEDTEGTPPSAGIDFEPNNPDEIIRRVLVKNCVIRGNYGAGIQGYFKNSNKGSEPFDITVENCTVRDNLLPVFFLGFEQGARGKLVLTNNDLFGFSLIPQIPEQLEIIKK